MRLSTVFQAAPILLAATAALSASPENAARFGAREGIEQLSLSPDGTKVAYAIPLKGQGSALFTMSVGDPASAKPAFRLDGDPERLGPCHWVSDIRLVCTIYGVVKGDPSEPLGTLPFTRLMAADVDGTAMKMLTPRQTSYSRGYQLGGGYIVDWLPDETDSVLMARQSLPDDRTGSRLGSSEAGLRVDRVDTRTLKATKVESPRDDAVEYISDGRGTVRIMGVRRQKDAAQYSSGVYDYFYRKRDSREWLPLGEHDTGRREGFEPYAVDPDSDTAFGFRRKDGRLALYQVALDGTKTEKLVLDRPDVDVDGLIRVGRRNRVVGASFATDVRQATYFDPRLAKLSTALAKALPVGTQLRFVDSSVDESRLLIWAGRDDDPGVYYIFNRPTGELKTFLVVRPEMEGATLAKVKPISFPAADGTQIPGYLTLPAGSSGKNLPAIVMPHGGPEARDEWGFDWLAQYYAAQGYAVIQPNFRGSAGYGDAWFEKNGFQSWKTAIGDVSDAGRWLVKQGIADPKKLAIVGWSYGGYAALQSAVVDPDLFKAVVAIAPVTDFAALKEENRYWSNYRVVADFIGSGPHIKEGSPAQNAGRIKAPVMLFHGALDRNVGIAQSELMALKLTESGASPTLVTWDKLDHYLEDSEARAKMLSESDAFLRKAMGL